MIIPPPPKKAKLFNPTWQLNTNTQNFDNVLRQTGTSLTSADSVPPAMIPDDMANGEAPKLKFNFTVEFAFRDNDPGVEDPIIQHSGHEEPEMNKFAILKVTRPQPTINYVKANFYNFRTNVATNVDYGTVNLVFYDDSSNRAHDIFDKYFSTVSPVFNWNQESRANTMDRNGFQGGGGDPSSGAVTSTGQHTASLGELEARHGPIRFIKVYHEYFLQPAGRSDIGPNQDSTRRTTVYTYLNPKIITANMDELDMSQSAVTTVDLTFNYDSVFVIHKDSPATPTRQSPR